jgi:universal stress protein A
MATLFSRILCPVDFDDNSMAALEFAANLAQVHQATLYVLHVVRAPTAPSEVPVEPAIPEWERDARARLDKVVRQHVDGKANFRLVMKTGDPFAAIMQAQRELNPDTVVMATHGRSGMSHLFLGSITERVVRESPHPVLTLRPSTGDAAATA